MTQVEEHSIDATTGLLDRQMIKAKIEQFLLGDFGTGQHAMLIMDIDNFKSLNETMGRVFADTIIQAIAEGILTCIRKEDFAGRVGGDEFLIFLKERTKEEVIDVAMQLNQMFYDMYTGDENSVRVTGSTGIALYPKDGKNYAELFCKADEAMYIMKQRGRNWYHFYNKADEEEFNPSLRKGRYQFDTYAHFPDAYGYNRVIATFAFDVLTSTKNLPSGMNVLLDRIGKTYSLDRIRLMWINYENRAFEVKYMWQDKIVVLPKEPLTHGHFASMEELCQGFGDTGVIEVAEVKEEEMIPDMYNSCLELDITAFISCGVYNEQNELCAYIGFECASGKREWTKEERDTFCCVTKIITHFLLVHADYKQSSKEIERLSNYDKVTGLYLYTNFKTEVSRVMSIAQTGKLAIVNSDISNFKYINETYGLEVGDKILKAFAEKCIIHNRFCIAGCRVYADNFIALVRTEGRDSLTESVVKLNEEFEREQRLFYPSSDFTIHTGICIMDRQDMEFVQILDGASLAKKMVKENRGLKYAFFDDTMKEMVLREGKVLAEVKAAILERKLVPFLQPKFRLDTREVVGAEALVRWRINEKEYYYPTDFIPVLEKSGNIIDVDFCIYQQVLEQIHKWLDEGRKVVPISVNISRVDCFSQDVEQVLIHMADQYEVPHHLIEIEITESAFFENTKILMEKLEYLREAGFAVSIDDFGSGYSSLGVISGMPIDIIKLDQLFLRSGLDSERSACVIETMIHLAQQMKLGFICEGVETTEQVEFLLKCGCQMGQGFLFAKPMPMEEFEEKYL